jgi:tRNA 2-thiouridine synthesizing protein A
MTTVLDLKGLSCPLPVLRTKKAIKDVAQGSTLQVHVTDPAAVNDFKAFCQATGNTLVDWTETAGVFQFTILKAA